MVAAQATGDWSSDLVTTVVRIVELPAPYQSSAGSIPALPPPYLIWQGGRKPTLCNEQILLPHSNANHIVLHPMKSQSFPSFVTPIRFTPTQHLLASELIHNFPSRISEGTLGFERVPRLSSTGFLSHFLTWV
jgi:hypothetical protein